jgi:hypothetical protein
MLTTKSGERKRVELLVRVECHGNLFVSFRPEAQNNCQKPGEVLAAEVRRSK